MLPLPLSLPLPLFVNSGICKLLSGEFEELRGRGLETSNVKHVYFTLNV